MPLPLSGPLGRLRHQFAPVLTGPPLLAFLPAVSLGAFWLGGETALLLASLGLPLLFALAGGVGAPATGAAAARDAHAGLMLRDGFDAAMTRIHAETDGSGLRSACFLLELDDLRALADRHGQGAVDVVMQLCGERIRAALREHDAVARIGDSGFAVCLRPVRQLDLELCIQLSGRMQAAVEQPVALDGIAVYVSCSVGFCLRGRAPGPDAATWFDAAAGALAEARLHGQSAIRAFAPDMMSPRLARADLRHDAGAALEQGEIVPWYQPQISTDTGQVTGFEALARWQHPLHGLIAPDAFLPALAAAGLSERLGQVMLYHALTALKAWDGTGAKVPNVGVNFGADELRNPGLADRIRWDLDRFALTPDRLTVEILETVVSDRPDDTVTQNIAALSALGCRIDLDDFGTGQASIAAIRRFSVSRIKIDRSFVMKADRDPDQQRMVAAILTLAERLGVETLAEGVETVGEHALLAQLGCDHVQGFGIARPMPFEQTLDWMAAHRAKLGDTPRIGRNTG
ncbi:MAG: putative bifunctional diguanylate cyclase/phosphodiesterase [Jhaorihella sp.]